VHSYFTQQSWDIVQGYIKAFSYENDTVFDPFCGTGVTFTEALMLKRKAKTTDLNPLAVFMSKVKMTKVNINDLQKEADKIIFAFKNLRPKDDKDIDQIVYLKKRYKDLMPENEWLHINSKKNNYFCMIYLMICK